MDFGFRTINNLPRAHGDETESSYLLKLSTYPVAHIKCFIHNTQIPLTSSLLNLAILVCRIYDPTDSLTFSANRLESLIQPFFTFISGYSFPGSNESQFKNSNCLYVLACRRICVSSSCIQPYKP